MTIYEAIVTEAEIRRHEWQRVVVADAQVTHAFAETGRTQWPQRVLATVRVLVTRRLTFSLPVAPRRCRVACGSEGRMTSWKQRFCLWPSRR